MKRSLNAIASELKEQTSRAVSKTLLIHIHKSFLACYVCKNQQHQRNQPLRPDYNRICRMTNEGHVEIQEKSLCDVGMCHACEVYM